MKIRDGKNTIPATVTCSPNSANPVGKIMMTVEINEHCFTFPVDRRELLEAIGSVGVGSMNRKELIAELESYIGNSVSNFRSGGLKTARIDWLRETVEFYRENKTLRNCEIPQSDSNLAPRKSQML